MADVLVAVQVAGATSGGDDAKADAPAVLLSAWFTKKAHKKLARTHKRFFELQADGLIRYYSAVTPEGAPVDEKGHIRIFTDTKVKVDGTALVVSTLSRTGTDTRDWHLAAEEGTVAAEWSEKIAEVQSTLTMDSALHLRNLQDSKAQDSQIINQLGDKVAGSIQQAAAIMRTFGFSGSVTVTGLMFGLSVSMGIEVEVEQGEGAVTTPAAPVDDDDDEDLTIEGHDNDEEEVDPVNLSPEKETRFRKGLKKGMNGAMAKVKVMAYHMRKYNLTGTVGVGVSLTMFGTGIELEFEVGLKSAITEIEYEAMKERDAEKAKAKAAKKIGASK